MIVNIKRKLASFLPEKVRMNMKLKKELRGGEVLLVHQMGKVGSTSVLRTLEDQLSIPVYQTHHLSSEAIRIATDFHLKHEGTVPYNIRFSSVLRKHLAGLSKIKIVTLVREPVAREMSLYFQLGERVFLEVSRNHEKEEIRKKCILKEILSNIDRVSEQNYFYNIWFDREMKGVFGVDVFDQEFDPAKGYSIMSCDNIEVLLIRTEDLDRVWESAISDFFKGGVSGPLQRGNTSATKPEADAWRYVKENLCLPNDKCIEIYNSRLTRHFYADMKDDLIRKWKGD